MSTAVEILQDLVSIPSASSLSNRPVIDYVLKRLNSKPWKITLYPYKDTKGVPKVNLVATTGKRDVELAFVCHTDTVPFDPAWSGAVKPVIRRGRLYGCGSCDVKGYLACVLAAFDNVNLTGLAKPLALVLTADEEVGCIGAKYLAKKKAFRSRYTLIGEPTGLQPVRAGKGYALAEIVVKGAEAHSAFPTKGRSAIYDAARVVLRLQAISEQLAERQNPAFDPPFTTLNVGLIQGGTAKNIIPGECRITVEWRPIPAQDPGWAAKLIRKELAKLVREFPGLNAKLDVKRLDPAFAPSKTDALSKLLESLTGSSSTTVAFGTEAAHLSPFASETVVFGPGDMTVAHRAGEHVRTSDLRQCVTHLTAVIQHLCS
jgi:acetylornithine deacetylase